MPGTAAWLGIICSLSVASAAACADDTCFEQHAALNLVQRIAHKRYRSKGDNQLGPESPAKYSDLSEAGYDLVAESDSDEEMAKYVKVLLASQGKKVREGCDDDLMGFVPYFSGSIAAQTLVQLVAELAKALDYRRQRRS